MTRDGRNTNVFLELGGNRLTVQNGGDIAVESGGILDLKASSVLKMGGVPVTADAADLNALTVGVAAGYKIARGQHETVAAADTLVTGLATVVAVIATLDDDPVDGAMFVTASIGNQAGAPAAGSVYIKTWLNTDGDASLVAATTFTKKVNWIAIGT
jgi:hypothetical protein